jgi:multicomponent Na+:H+ antiporter subunit G
MSVRDVVSMVLMAIGALLALVAALGVLRMPDLYMRMSASAKASTLGVGCFLAAAAVHFDDLAIASRAVAVIVFVLSTTPVAAHMIGRAAYLVGVPLWDRTMCDELGKHGDAAARSQPPSDPR